MLVDFDTFCMYCCVRGKSRDSSTQLRSTYVCCSNKVLLVLVYCSGSGLHDATGMLFEEYDTVDSVFGDVFWMCP